MLFLGEPAKALELLSELDEKQTEERAAGESDEPEPAKKFTPPTQDEYLWQWKVRVIQCIFLVVLQLILLLSLILKQLAAHFSCRYFSFLVDLFTCFRKGFPRALVTNVETGPGATVVKLRQSTHCKTPVTTSTTLVERSTCLQQTENCFLTSDRLQNRQTSFPMISRTRTQQLYQNTTRKGLCRRSNLCACVADRMQANRLTFNSMPR